MTATKTTFEIRAVSFSFPFIGCRSTGIAFLGKFCITAWLNFFNSCPWPPVWELGSHLSTLLNLILYLSFQIAKKFKHLSINKDNMQKRHQSHLITRLQTWYKLRVGGGAKQVASQNRCRWVSRGPNHANPIPLTHAHIDTIPNARFLMDLNTHFSFQSNCIFYFNLLRNKANTFKSRARLTH